jgi:hypothetical protein
VASARYRQIAHEQAELMADMVAIGHSPPDGPGAPPLRTAGIGEFAADEIAFALGWTRRAADTQFSLAVALVETLPDVHAALTAAGVSTSPGPGSSPT